MKKTPVYFDKFRYRNKCEQSGIKKYKCELLIRNILNKIKITFETVDKQRVAIGSLIVVLARRQAILILRFDRV
jgi:hypothetical protein